ncbi:hypothetical protein ACLQ2R_22000 [Streptosporangium sp. DT93]|uniref:hypothetical protein n=1 Tax=Streptosporangium sp. DT93 TaxID=3393428 RepID=UPI003CF17132
MRTGYGEASVMFGYVLGAVVTTGFQEWARGSDRALLAEVLFVCSQLFMMAFLFGVVRFLFRGLRWAGRLPARRRRAATPESPSPVR